MPGRIVFGAGRRSETPGELASLGASRVLIIGGSHDTATIDDLVSQLHMPVETIIGVRPHVPAAVVRAALDVVDSFEPNTVLTIGGGSSTGLAKMVALERDVALLAIPTTYAGSEMTPIWGTSDGGAKKTGRSLRVLPSTVIYDPELTVGLPREVTVNSACNALAHCVEAMWLPDTSPITIEGAVVAIKAIVDAVEDVADRLDDIEARSRLLYGAHRAGSVLATAGTGLLHKTAHVLGGMFDLDHGAMYAVLTPHVVAHQLSAMPDIHQRFHDALGPDPAEALHALIDRLAAPSSLADIGFPADRFDEAAEAIAEHADVDLEEVEPVLTAAAQPATETA
ncbi:MAG: maleylacetate reductase [Acidimicrobiia bacterium]|nr:maleylacetate reductase [Acidimicrobiia bacterium]